MAKKKKKNFKTKIIILNIIYVITFIFSVSSATIIVLNKYYDKKEIAKVEEMIVFYNDIYLNTSNLIEELRVQYKNNDVEGILEIDDLGISTPLVQTDDNKYYLTHLIDNTKSRYGSTFIDYRVDMNTSPQIVIYGHNKINTNTKEVLPFQKLNRYLDETKFKKSKNIVITTVDKTFEYEIVAIKIASKETIYEHEDFVSIKKFDKYITLLTEDSLYKKDINITREDQLLILQTCVNYIDEEDPEDEMVEENVEIDKFLMIIAKRADKNEK